MPSCPEGGVLAGRGDECVPRLLGIGELVIRGEVSVSLAAKCLRLALRNAVVSTAEESRMTISESGSLCSSSAWLPPRVGSLFTACPLLFAESPTFVAASCSRWGLLASIPCSADRRAACCCSGIAFAALLEEVEGTPDSKPNNGLRVGSKYG